MHQLFARDVRKYYLFQFLNGFMFFSPVIVLFWQSHGLSMTQVMFLQSIYSLGVVLLDLPTGAFADCFGKRRSLIVGVTLWTLSFVMYSLSSQFWQFAIWEVTAGIGSAFVSGADRSYLHQMLREEGNGHLFKKTEGKARGLFQFAQALGSIIGGFLANIALSLTLLATGISTLFSLLVASSFPTIKEQSANDDDDLGYWATIRESLRLVKNHRRLLWLSLFFACFHGLLWALYFYAQPFLQLLKVPVYYFGFIYFGFSIVAAVGTMVTHHFEGLVKEKVFVVMSVLGGGSLLVISLTKSLWVFPLWALFTTLVFMNQTIIADQVLQIVPPKKAATVLSFQSLLRRLLYALTAPILGIVTDNLGLRWGLVSYSVFLLAIFGGLLLVEPRSDS